MIEEKGGKCIKCGYDKCLSALHFHHREPAEKNFEISGAKLSLARMRAEASKCDLLCANCHIEHHVAIDTSF